MTKKYECFLVVFHQKKSNILQSVAERYFKPFEENIVDSSGEEFLLRDSRLQNYKKFKSWVENK
ncbi:hypothetical protein WN51_09756 [Melipona quadrifasciata]|uniref:Uncharacterized protein n=1 Tax=Melipona quadrifasciata TaxID=166423 RepID=A0A0N0U6B3_9HYME|nr:hypothetical protein WN51_09756 [Melipona quadrifasciata]